MKKSSVLFAACLLSATCTSLWSCGDTPQTGFLLGVGPCVSLVKTRNFCQTIPTAQAQAALDNCQIKYVADQAHCAAAIAAAASCAEKHTCAQLADVKTCSSQNTQLEKACGDVTADANSAAAADGNTTTDPNASAAPATTPAS